MSDRSQIFCHYLTDKGLKSDPTKISAILNMEAPKDK